MCRFARQALVVNWIPPRCVVFWNVYVRVKCTLYIFFLIISIACAFFADSSHFTAYCCCVYINNFTPDLDLEINIQQIQYRVTGMQDCLSRVASISLTIFTCQNILICVSPKSNVSKGAERAWTPIWWRPYWTPYIDVTTQISANFTKKLRIEKWFNFPADIFVQRFSFGKYGFFFA